MCFLSDVGCFFVVCDVQEFLECFKELGDIDKRREEYFRLYSQLYYVIQRNTKEEVVQELLPKVRFPPPSSAVSRPSTAAAAAAAAADTTVKMPQRVYIAEKGSVIKSNEAVLQQMQDTLKTLMEETQALREQISSTDQEIAQLSDEVLQVQDALLFAFEQQQ